MQLVFTNLEYLNEYKGLVNMLHRLETKINIMALKKLLYIVTFQIGVNIIGIPDFHHHAITLYKSIPSKNRFHK